MSYNIEDIITFLVFCVEHGDYKFESPAAARMFSLIQPRLLLQWVISRCAPHVFRGRTCSELEDQDMNLVDDLEGILAGTYAFYYLLKNFILHQLHVMHLNVLEAQLFPFSL